jgi:hypothetical protein
LTPNKWMSKGFHPSCSRSLTVGVCGFHVSGLCTLPYLLRLLMQTRCYYCNGRYGSKLAYATLNLYPTIRTLLPQRGIVLRHPCITRVANRSPFVRTELGIGTHIRCLPSRILTGLPTLCYIIFYERSSASCYAVVTNTESGNVV